MLVNVLSALYPKDCGEKRVLGEQRTHHYMLNGMRKNEKRETIASNAPGISRRRSS